MMNLVNIKVGDQIELNIRKQGINGEGIGYYNKLAIFVRGAIAKEDVLCTVTEVKNGYAYATIDEIKRVSTKRVEAPCKFYDRCGGCQIQHIDYTEQLKMKQSIIKQAIRKYLPSFKDERLIQKTLGMKDSFGYRNKSQMPFRNLNFGLSYGLYEESSNHFVFIDDCIVLHPMVNKINKETISILRAHNVFANDPINKKGILLNQVTRYFESTKEASVTFIVTHMDDVLREVASELMKKIPEVKSVSVSVNQRKSISIFGKETFVIAGKEKIRETVGDLTIEVSPDAFHQLNTNQMNVLYNEVFHHLNLTGKELVIDCFSGIGITSLLFAKKVKKVYGIDYSLSSIKDARENAKINSITNTEMLAEHVESALPRLISSGVKPNIVLFDPPRTGLNHKLIEALNTSSVETLVYISCNPSTLAKNLNDLRMTYEVTWIQPLDMFPHTSSVESITILKRKN